MGRPERVTPAVLQSCLFYTITVRLAPYWNKAGHLLIQGADFLSKSGKQDAVAISINVLENQLFITVQVYTVRLPPCQLCDFDFESECFKGSLDWNTTFTRKKNDSNNWCYVLPSMKMGRIVHFSHNIPPECPFKSYQDFENYWKMLYGYELPHMSEDDVIYCSVYFKLIGEKLFTYPFICLRSQPIQFFPRADLPRVLNTFVDYLKSKMPHLCGFPLNMTKTPLYPVKELSRPPPEGNNTLLTNLTPAMSPKNSDQSMYSTHINQRTISMEQSLERCSEKMEHPSTSLYVEQKTSYNVPPESKHSDSSHPIFSTNSGNIQKYVPVFGTKTGKNNKNGNMKITEGNKIGAGSNIFDNSNFKDVMPSRMPYVQISDARMNRANNILHKPITMKSGKKVLVNSTLPPCLSALSEKPSCISGSLVPGNNTSDSNPNIVKSSQSSVPDSCTLYCTNDKTACISHKRKEDYNVSESVKTSRKNMAAGPVHKDILQGSEEHLLVPPKKCRTSKSVKKVDVEQYAQDNKLFKLNNADLQDWLKQHGISTRARDKKEQLVAKILQFIQQS